MSMPVETIISEQSAVSDQRLADDERTLTESGFYWREREGVKVLVCKQLEDAGFLNGFSTRIGGVSDFPKDSLNLAGFDEDAAENIYENRRRFLRVFDGQFALATAWQVHGDGVKTVRTEDDVRNSEERFDALASSRAQTLVGVKTADCVPVLLADPANGAFGAVHAGWKGTAAAIVVRAIEKLAAEFGSKAENLLAAIGPSASCDSYEVGSDVIERFAASFANHEKYFTATQPGHAFVDLKAANRDLLISAGVDPANISVTSLCTMARTDLFFSYRVEKKKIGKTGRLLSVIGRQ
ncbi:MAG: peptidoglycan editing factor PgeF [Acidobacteria bacterium]|nr:MAG: peptidoglycan editing factor PgeF [Acidobacteriota bacterium]